MQILTKGGRHPGLQATRRSNRRAAHQGWPAGCAPAIQLAGLAAPASSRLLQITGATPTHRPELLGSWTASLGSINAAAWRSNTPSLMVLAP